jgi:hypothetical protein
MGKRIGTPLHSGPATMAHEHRGRAKPQVMACRFHDEAQEPLLGGGYGSTCNMSVVLTFYKYSLLKVGERTDNRPLFWQRCMARGSRSSLVAPFEC